VHPWWDRRVVGRHITVDAETAEWTRVALDRMLAIT
jgi:quinolinate synthase